MFLPYGEGEGKGKRERFSSLKRKRKGTRRGEREAIPPPSLFPQGGRSGGGVGEEGETAPVLIKRMLNGNDPDAQAL